MQHSQTDRFYKTGQKKQELTTPWDTKTFGGNKNQAAKQYVCHDPVTEEQVKVIADEGVGPTGVSG